MKTKKIKKQDWHLRHGSEILSVILDQLTDDEKKEAKRAGFVFDPSYEPEPSIGRMRGGTVVPRGPITEAEFNNLSLEDIAAKMRDKWKPEELLKQNTSDDFLRPLNAEGVGDLLRKDIPKRLQEYVDKAPLFFERDVIDQHYTYSYLRGIQELIRADRVNTSSINWDKIISLFISIKDSGEAKPFDPTNRERHSFDAWLAGWNAVNSAMTDMIQELLQDVDRHASMDFPKHRDNLFGVVSYLLNYSDPTPEDEKIETAKVRVKDPEDAEYSMSDPFTSAINTVRGRAFQAFAMFVFQDGKKFTKEDKIKISADVKDLYESVLFKENTLALMFMFGHYIPNFYYRDIGWMRSLAPQIFPAEDNKKDLYLAAWEGYLSSNLYGDIFLDPVFVDLYSKAIAFPSDQYTKRRYFRKLDDGLATHLALAFLYFDTFGFEHELFKSFWSTKNIERHSGFISFIGRHYISGEDKRSSTALTQEQIVSRLKQFWDWALENCDDPKALSEFGYWMNADKKVLDSTWLAEHIRKTLEKTEGDIVWEYGLMKSLVTLAKEAPEDTLQILRLYLINLANPKEPTHGWIYIESEVFEALKIIYLIPSLRERVRNLVSELLPLANGRFWKLKEIL